MTSTLYPQCTRCPSKGPFVVDGLCKTCYRREVIERDGEVDSLFPTSKCCGVPLRGDPRGFNDCTRCGRQARV